MNHVDNVYRLTAVFIIALLLSSCTQQDNSDKLPTTDTAVKGLTSEMTDKPGVAGKSESTGASKKKDRSADKKAKSAGRSPEAISAVAKSYNAKIQNCFKTAKLLDATLQGKVKILFVVSPSGEVLAVKFVRSDWSDKSHGGDVEVCITNEVKSWKFPAIDESGGNVTAAQSYTFE